MRRRARRPREKVDDEGWKETTIVGRCETRWGCERRGEEMILGCLRVVKDEGGQRVSTNRIDSLSRASVTFLYCRPTSDQARSYPFRLSLCSLALFIYQPSYTWTA